MGEPGGDPAPRVVVVRSPSVARETFAVLRALGVVAVIAVIAVTAKLGRGDRSRPASRPATPDLVAFRELDPADQRMYRRCLEGLAEAEDVRSRTGQWPNVDELAARAIPPFAADPIDRAGYRWQRLLDGTLVNYLGVPEAAARPTILIMALEPDPGTPLDPAAVVDESHHKLRDGTLLHVSISLGTARTLGRPLAMPAFADGWRLVVLATP